MYKLFTIEEKYFKDKNTNKISIIYKLYFTNFREFKIRLREKYEGEIESDYFDNPFYLYEKIIKFLNNKNPKTIYDLYVVIIKLEEKLEFLTNEFFTKLKELKLSNEYIYIYYLNECIKFTEKDSIKFLKKVLRDFSKKINNKKTQEILIDNNMIITKPINKKFIEKIIVMYENILKWENK